MIENFYLTPLKSMFEFLILIAMIGKINILRYGALLGIFFISGFFAGAFSQDTTDMERYFPDIQITNSNDPSSGYFFIATKKHYVDTVNYFTIIDNYGTPVYFRLVNDMAAGIQVRDGYIYMLEGPEKVYFKIDSFFHKLDTFKTKGYKLNGHDFDIDENGHYLLLGSQLRTVDMTQYGGPSNATVRDMVVQEFDADKNLIFTWKAWEHYQITDANENSPYVDLTASTVDYLHANSIKFDSDTSFLLSCRHFDEITKIDRRTGDIIWRLGGKHNEFTFVNDTIHFSHPHTVRIRENGNIQIFDNGDLHNPQITSVVEYRLDEVNKVATLVRRQYHVPDVYVVHGGGEQMLPDGDLLVYWGEQTPSFTEYHPDGSVAIEMDYSSHSFASRVAKAVWKHKVFVTATDTINFGMWDGYTEAEYLLTLHNNTDSVLKITGYLTHTDNFSINEDFPVEIPAHGDKDITVVYFPQNAQTGYINDVLTVQSEYPHLYLAQQVVMIGRTEDIQAPEATITPDTAHVPRNAIVRVNFTEPVRLTTRTELNYQNVDTMFAFKKDGPDGESVAYNANVSTDKKHIEIIPADSLDPDQTYFIQVREGLEDYSGNLLSPVSGKFSTGSEISAVLIHENHEVQVYPNPTDRKLVIQTDLNSTWKVQIFSILGTLMTEKDNISGHKVEMKLSHLNPGMYFVVVTANGKKIKSKKVIIK
ncbi:MAG TPA: T9SS type A sorting domain-containing protein [Bacteroidetes bacterium]|nr:T9SS type A sorting domain-containing protein [Bacteroidota bacterium]